MVCFQPTFHHQLVTRESCIGSNKVSTMDNANALSSFSAGQEINFQFIHKVLHRGCQSWLIAITAIRSTATARYIMFLADATSWYNYMLACIHNNV